MITRAYNNSGCYSTNDISLSKNINPRSILLPLILHESIYQGILTQTKSYFPCPKQKSIYNTNKDLSSLLQANKHSQH